MPFSALSPDGPVTLLGVDPLTVERMRDRNCREKLYTAKCCGAPLVIRTVQGKIPHFVHATTPSFCEGDNHVSPEHLRLQAAVALTKTIVRSNLGFVTKTFAMNHIFAPRISDDSK